MKKLILEHLRSLKEGADVSTQADYDRLKDQVEADEATYAGDEYMMSDKIGDGIYEVKVTPKGTFDVRQTKRASFIGFPRKLHNRWYFYVRAYCSRTDDKCEGNKSYGPSAADDAATKVRVIYGREILEFVKLNIPGEDAYTSDDKGAEISAKNMSDAAARKKIKKDFEMKLGRRVKPSEWDRYLQTGEEPGTKPVAEPTDRSAEISQIEKRMNLLYQMKDAKRIKDKELRKATINDLKNQLANL
jgi:hypothetical protein